MTPDITPEKAIEIHDTWEELDDKLSSQFAKVRELPGWAWGVHADEIRADGVYFTWTDYDTHDGAFISWDELLESDEARAERRAREQRERDEAAAAKRVAAAERKERADRERLRLLAAQYPDELEALKDE